jgi:hypothetical protein
VCGGSVWNKKLERREKSLLSQLTCTRRRRFSASIPDEAGERFLMIMTKNMMMMMEKRRSTQLKKKENLPYEFFAAGQDVDSFLSLPFSLMVEIGYMLA